MLSNLWKVRQWTRNNENHWISCQRGTHPFLESSAPLNLGPNYGLQMTSPPHPLKEKKPQKSKIFVSLWERAQWSRKAPPAKSQMKEELHIPERPRQTIQEGIRDGCSSMQGNSMVCCTSSCSCGGEHQAVTSQLVSHPSVWGWGQAEGAGTGQDGSCSPADITHSCDGNLEPFYKEKVTVLLFRARWKSELPLKPAESKWNKRKERWKGQTCTGDFLLLGQAEGSGRTALPHGLCLLQACEMYI